MNLQRLVAAAREPAEQPSQAIGQVDEWNELGVASHRQLRHVHGGSVVAEDQRVAHRLADLDPDAFLGLARRCAQVGNDHHVVQLEQGVVGGHRLLLEDIEGSARQLSTLERLGEGRLIDDAAPRRVDQVGGGLHQRQLLGADEPASLLGQRRVHGDHVGFFQKVGQRHQIDPRLLGALGRQVGIVSDHPHPERTSAPRHLRADAARAGQPERLAVQLDPLEAAALPPPTAHRCIGLGDMPDQRQQQRERMLGRRHHVAAGRVEDDDAAACGVVDVDVVHTHARPPQHLQVRAGLHDLGRHLGAAAHDQRVVRPDDRAELLAADPPACIHRHPWSPLQDLDALRRDLVRKQHPHPGAGFVHANLDPVSVRSRRSTARAKSPARRRYDPPCGRFERWLRAALHNPPRSCSPVPPCGV